MKGENLERRRKSEKKGGQVGIRDRTKMVGVKVSEINMFSLR